MQLIELTEQDKQRYQSFVQANGSFLQDWDWGDFQKNEGKKVLRVAVLENGEFVATAQILESDFGGKNYLFAPYGPVAQKNSIGAAAIKFIIEEVGKKYPNAIFFRIEPQQRLTMAQLTESIGLNPHKTLILNLHLSEEQIFQQMHPKTRYNIRVAQKHGVITKITSELGAGGQLFQDSADRARVKTFSQKYYADILQYFAEGKNIKARLYTAYHENDALAASLMLYWGDTVIYLFGGSGNNKRNLKGPHALHWQAIQDAKRNGYSKYDFWGVEPDPSHPWYGFSKFKLGFGGEIVDYFGTHDYVYKPAWYNIYKILRKLNRLLR